MCSPYIVPSSGFTCSSSSGWTCFNTFDEDVSTFWTTEWDNVEKDRYAQGFMSWIQISFNEKLTVSRLDLFRQLVKTGMNGEKECSNFKDVELAFEDGKGHTWSLITDKNQNWQTIQISPNVRTSFIKISDTTGENDVTTFCESAISEVRVWGCNSDYIQRNTGKNLYLL